jgi:hypothetical protein
VIGSDRNVLLVCAHDDVASVPDEGMLVSTWPLAGSARVGAE